MIGKAIAAGALLPTLEKVRLDSWAACDNFCTPNFDYDPIKNPQGKENCGKVIRLAMGMRDSVLNLLVPTISGKDSVKNSLRIRVPADFPFDKLPPDYQQFFIIEEEGNERILHIHDPPTLLMSTLARIPNYTRIPGQDFKREGDLVYIIGMTRDELGGTEYYEMKGIEERRRRYLGSNSPRVSFENFISQSRAMEQLIKEGTISSASYLHKGGLGVGAFKAAAINNLGISLDLSLVPSQIIINPEEILFSRTPGRYLVSIDPRKREKLENTLSQVSHACIGEVQGNAFGIRYDGKAEHAKMHNLLLAYKKTFQHDLPPRWDR
jgi:phosphoribosylformylglycinamidine synthase